MQFTQRQIILLGGGVLILAIVGLIFFLGLRGTSSQSQKLTLTVWGMDRKSIFDDMASAYKAAAPGVTVEYTQIDPASYDATLLKAFAAGTGPDIFEIGNRELPKWQSVATPLPATFASTFNLAMLQNNFVGAVNQDFVSNNSIYALPLDMDTLAMYYNKDLFDTAGIVYPPKTWDEFDADVTKLRILNGGGQITQAAAAIGGSQASIPNAPDLVALLMLQNGAQMVASDRSSASFGTSQANNTNPGLAAFNFYLQFANSASSYYTWNDAMGDALQSFVARKTAIFFDYASAVVNIKQKDPFLNFGVAAMPQPAGASVAVNYPRYEGLAVSRQGQVNAAWQFILYATTNTSAEGIYAKDAGELPASRDYIAANLSDPTYGVFASQALTARSWYEADDGKIDGIMNTAIENVLNGSNDSERALGVAQDAVSAVMRGQ